MTKIKMEYNDYLYHHGIKGMKWGVRRYQNKDGALTPAGKRRVSNKEIREYEKSVRKEIEAGSSKERMAIRAEREKADKEYQEYAKKHGLLEEDQDPTAYWDDYEKRFDVYDKALSIHDKVNDREYELDMTQSKRVTDRMIERFGQERMDKFERSERTKALVAVGMIAIPLAAMSLPVAAVAVPVVAVAAVASAASNKKKTDNSDKH